jgi:hypothetical protein
MGMMAIAIGDRVRLRKAHPCGGREWTVHRTGADVGLTCATCGRRIMLERELFERSARLVRPSAATSPREES